jgi:hypothetical protein
MQGKETAMKHDNLGVNPLAPADVIADQVKQPIIHPGIRQRHAEMIATLVATIPTHIRFVADAQDVLDRAMHIKAVGIAFALYIEELIDDTGAKLNTGSIDRDAHYQIRDTIGDLVGQMMDISDDLAEGSDWS